MPYRAIYNQAKVSCRLLKWAVNIGEDQFRGYAWSDSFFSYIWCFCQYILIQTLMSTLFQVLNTHHLFQQLLTKHKDIRHAWFLLSLCAIPISTTKMSMSTISLPPVLITYPHHLPKPCVGPFKSWIRERIGDGKSDGVWRLIQAGYPHPRLPEHQFHVLKSARPTWIMKST